jgi:hypothetical protein
MKFLGFIKADESYRHQGPPPALMEAMGKFVQESFQSGVLADTGGLKPSASAGRIRIQGGKLTVTDGPFSETKEVVGGWAIMQGRSKDEVLAVSRRFMELHQQYWPGWEGTSELYEMEEYGDAP